MSYSDKGLIDPANQAYQGHLMMGLAQLAGGEFEPAAHSFRRVLDMSPINEEAKVSLAEATSIDEASAPARRQVCKSVRERYAGRQSLNP